MRALELSVLSPQNDEFIGSDDNVSGQLTVSATIFSDSVHADAMHATAFKTLGLNNNGVPLTCSATSPSSL